MLKILVIQTAFIGDAVLATGILEKLHARFPDAQLDYMVRKGNEGLFKGHPYLHELIVWDKQKGKMANLFRLLSRIRATRYDKVINVQRFAATGLLTAFSGAGETIGYDKNPWSRFFTTRVPHIISTAEHPKHEVERCNDLIRHFTDDEVFPPRLYPSAEDFGKVAGYKGQPFICIAPASVWYTKQYPAAKWIAFLDRVPSEIKVYILGAPGDKELAKEIIGGTRHPAVVSLCGELGMLQSAALMKDALMNYVNDSAPMHFASSVNAPTAAIYCSTIPAFGFGPLSDGATIIQTRVQLDCRPCGLHGHAACPKGHFKCAFTIEEEQLLACLPQ